MYGIDYPVLTLTPFESPDVRLCAALARGGALSVLDLGRDAAIARAALAELAAEVAEFGVRIPRKDLISPADLPEGARVIVVPTAGDAAAFAGHGRTVFVQVTSLAEAKEAEAAGADALIAKGCEAGGRVGDEGTFLLLQRIALATKLPVWAQGGIGVFTAAAAIAGGAAGVVLDSQLALLRESSAPEDLKKVIRALDGSETAVAAGHRVLSRPDAAFALPLGQDVAFARAFAERFRGAASAVRGIHDAIASALASARTQACLAAGAPLAVAHQLRYPIFQGPMTRVSDRAAFALAVAEAGALPFLALALLRGEEVRALVTETQALLGERPFGVGILGFVPPELREEQLLALEGNLPPIALIAGGRPSQARPLEARGTATYLHVPSPGLLDLFVGEGARRFVFEGSECGGHVGPRTSFALWEVQLERLLSVRDPENLHLIFAGGIHDARSAAMVAAMAAPFAARGAKIGVLMGTAYLFTHEAVRTGAIEPTYQEEALRCERTSLLETAPGHNTRCVETEYVRAFSAEKQRLVADGVGPKEVWAALEQLNLGRLRIASKGLSREGGSLVHVDADRQRKDGMYMIGQVATLRGGVTSMAALHDDVSRGGSAHLMAAKAPARTLARGAKPVDVAIVGMACLFPSATDKDAFWSNIVRAQNAITEVPLTRWNPEIYFDPQGKPGEKTPSKWGGFLPDIPFDPAHYGIPPRSLAAIEPVQLLSLEVARRALADAGYDKRDFDRERASVIFGAEAGTDLAGGYGFRALWPQYVGALPPELDAVLPSLTEDSFPGVLANVIAGRIANRLDLGGVNYTVDAACAASLAALDLAVKELVLGTSDMVLCGGADLHNSIQDYLLFASVHALSPSGQCRTFDSTADGIALGEGVAAVVLKRLCDAERDGDRVYAVIKGIGGSSDGKSLGLTAPHKDGQIRALERAYRQGGVSPSEIGLVEAHGTGTIVGDKTELATLSEVYVRAGVPPRSVALGSVKSQIGHTKCAAGLAGVIKAALSIHHGVLPPTLHVRAPNPYYDPKTSPFVFSETARPWAAAVSERKAAVSAFGFGGTNFHAVLAGYDANAGATESAAADGSRDSARSRLPRRFICAPGSSFAPSSLAKWPAELFLFRGPDRAAASRTLDRLLRRLDAGDPPPLASLARTVCATSPEAPVQVAIVAASHAELHDRIALARRFAGGPQVFVSTGVSGEVAFLFPGQGSQRIGMLGELFVAFPALQRWLRQGGDYASKIFPGSAFSPESRAAQQAALTDTRVAQPALGLCGRAMSDLLGAVGVVASHAAGHSYGELVALSYAGALGDEDFIALSAARGEHILAAAGDDPGSMAAVAASPADVERALAVEVDVVLANRNAPGQTVISGPKAQIAAALAKLETLRIAARLIPVACAFHSPVVAAAQDTLGVYLEGVPVAAPRIPVWSNAEAAVYPSEQGAIRQYIARHVARPVRFDEQIAAMHEAGARIFVESGPGRVQSGLVGKILSGRPHLAVPCDEPGQDGITSFLSALATLAVHGVPVDPAALFTGRAETVDLDAPPLAAAATLWLVNGQRARPAHGEAPAGGLKPVSSPVVRSLGQAARPAGDDRDSVMVEYLRGARALAEQQREIMLRYLGTEPAHVATSSYPEDSVVPRAPQHLEARIIDMTEPPEAAAAQSIAETLLEIVSVRTGYPVEMLGLDLDLEAELSIDSIKRIEILGELAQKTGMNTQDTAARDEIIEQLAGTKTLRAIIEWLERRALAPAAETPLLAAAGNEVTAMAASARGGGNGSGRGNGHAAVDDADFEDAEPTPMPMHPAQMRRFRLALTPAEGPVQNGLEVTGRTFVLVDDPSLGGRRALAAALRDALTAAGARVVVLSADEPLPHADALVFLPSLDASPNAERFAQLFARTREAVAQGAQWLVALTGLGGDFGRGPAKNGADPSAKGSSLAGVAGFLKSVAKEMPEVCVRAVDLDPDEAPALLAARVLREILGGDGLVQVGYRGEERLRLSPVVAERERATEGVLSLPRGAVILITGGARGITARVARALAEETRCTLEIVGRTPLYDPQGKSGANGNGAHQDSSDDEATRGLADPRALRGAILRAHPGLSISEVEARCSRLLGEREVSASLASLRAAGATVRYHALDVRDETAFGALIERLYDEHGRIDGVVHGAGVIEDKLLRDKSPESFARVYETKVAGARSLLRHLRDDVSFVAFFGSVSGTFGNRGQADYAAANDALAQLAHALDERLSGRVVSIDWGPWAGTGMVSPELEREYARRGIGLIPPEEGARAFLREVAAATQAGADAQVILLCADPAQLI